MPGRWLGIVVGADEVTVVDAEIPDDTDAPIVIQSDQSWPLQSGARPDAYCVMHQQVANYAKESGIKRAVIKASALSQGKTLKGHLKAAELRGVVMCALAGVTTVKCRAKAHTSKTFGERKVDEYVKDDGFWKGRTEGKGLRKGSREAALVILAERKANA
jgi:hypothetical protein